MCWNVYLLHCADGTLYCGVTTDLARRLAEHNAGHPGGGAKYTRARLPVVLAASAPCADKGAALRLEFAVKKRPRAAKLAFLLQQPGAALPSGQASAGTPGTSLSETSHFGVSPSCASLSGTSPSDASLSGTSHLGTNPSGTSPSGTSPSETSHFGVSPSGTSSLGASPSGTSPSGALCADNGDAP